VSKGDGNETALKKIIDKQCVAKSVEDRNGKVRTSLYASDYGQCARRVFCQFFPEKYPQEEISPRTIRVFQTGDKFHELLGEYLKRESGLEFQDEREIPRDALDVHGRCDGLAMIDGRMVVVEFKSINKASMYDAKDEHIGQLTWYMAMWNKLRCELREDFGIGPEEDVSAGLQGEVGRSGRRYEDLSLEEQKALRSNAEPVGELIYISKQSQELFHFSVDWDAQRVKKVRDWFEMVKWHVDHRVVPNVRYQKDRWPCSWGKTEKTYGKCPFYRICYGE
jgi:CRISPR/Cas system-associated exonuclease Cas4 (RecB family)